MKGLGCLGRYRKKLFQNNCAYVFKNAENPSPRHAQTQALAMHKSSNGVAGRSVITQVQKCLDITSGSKRIDHGSVLVPDKVIQSFCDSYTELDASDKQHVLLHICSEYGTQSQDRITDACKSYLKKCDEERVNNEKPTPTAPVQERLRLLLQPEYFKLFNLIGRLRGGVKFLMNVRVDAAEVSGSLQNTDDSVKLKLFSAHLKEILSHWFSVGLLQLSRVTWESPACVLEKVGKYEAVHEIRSWTDLKHRLGHDRRCYAFLHSALPGEPLVVLHVALTDSISERITEIVKPPPPNARCHDDDDEERSTAIFYSITSTQPGLKGIDFSVHIIRRVVATLRGENPSLTRFSSLSPIPLFRSWLRDRLRSDGAASLLTAAERRALGDDADAMLTSAIADRAWMDDAEMRDLLRAPLMRLCAEYLHGAKRRGAAFDPVAAFHLRNGAVMWRLNWLADPSVSGHRRSLGIMCNYRYYLERMDENSLAYVAERRVCVGEHVRALLPAAARL